MATFWVRNATNTGWLDATTVSNISFRNSTNTGWLSKTGGLAAIDVRNATNSGWINIPFAAPPPATTQLALVTNDLDFVYTGYLTSLSEPAGVEYVVTTDSVNFYANNADHIVYALDCYGNAGDPGTLHCGPILRRGENLFTKARGFIIRKEGAEGVIYAEHWDPSFPNGFALSAPLISFSLSSYPVFTTRLRAGYRSGALANTMSIEVFGGTSTSALSLLYTTVPWGWDWFGSHRAALGGIALGFVSPNSTGCVEQIVPRTAPNAVLPYSISRYVTL